MKAFSLTLLTIFLCVDLVAAQTGEIVPGDNLIIEGVPKIPASLAAEIDRYQSRTATLLDWHPSRREMLIRTRFADTAQIHLVEFPGGARRQLTFFADSIAGGSYNPQKPDHFVFSKDSGGNGLLQMYLYDLGSGDITLLTDGKSRNDNALWSNAGDKIVYRSPGRNGLYVVEPSDPKNERLLAKFESGNWIPVDWSPDDRKILVIESVSVGERYLWLFDAASGEKTLLTPKNWCSSANTLKKIKSQAYD
ncbi:MAG: hypothetical protein LC742_00305 [Acidobacteria bacterium]|nr:hypothetical protein [Acidobacteriota bacterium]